MKGVILAGGTGSRLFPCTKVTNKHLLPVYNKPMIYYPIETLKNSGIRDILVVSSPDNIGDFMRLLGSGSEFNVNFTYKIQDGAGGIAQALSLAEDFSSGEDIAVILSDNIFEEAFSEEVFYFKGGAQIFVKETEDPSRFGVVEIRENGSVRSIEEKPSFPKSNFAQTGFYLYDRQVFDFIRTIQPSKRGELEITDVNQSYLEKDQLKARKINGVWADAGTFESLLEANVLAQEAFDPERVKQFKKDREKIEVKPSVAPKVSVGLLSHNSIKYIQPCLRSLQAQDYDNISITVLDNNSTDDSVNMIRDQFPEVKIIESTENTGFGKGHNRLISETEGEFYACLNIDMIFEPNFISSLVKGLTEKPTYGSAGGKLKRWDFGSSESDTHAIREQGKTNFIDSVGIKILKNHRFEDIGQGEVDYGQYDQARDIFGISGAAVLFRRKALEDTAFVKEDKSLEFFDESMFMYKEDIDLAYRLQWAGWKCRYTPVSIAYHDRTAAASGLSTWEIIKNRSKKPSYINRNSHLNHQILLQKNYATGEVPFAVRNATGWYNFKVFLYILLLETETLGQYWKLLRMQREIKARAKSMPRRVGYHEIEQFMEN